MARIKGTAVSASAAYLKERLGGAPFVQMLDGLSPEARRIFIGAISSSGWYEFSHLLELMEAAESRLPRGRRSLAWEMGRYSAESGLKTVYKIFFKVADVGFILKKASQLFSNYYDSGSMVVEHQAHGTATLALTGFDQPNAYFCDRLLGWMERTVELTGAKGVKMSHPKCRVRGDDRCEYLGYWI